jgi:MFS family permease
MLLWSGQMVSGIGTNASGIAFPLLVLALTHSALQAGLVGALQRLPFLILTLPAGAMVDRWDRKLTMIVFDAARAVAFAAIPLAAWSGHLTLPLIYVAVLVEGTAFSFFNLAEASALPRVVAEEQLPGATAQNQMSYALSALIGPPIAGLLFAVRRTLPFLVDAISYAASIISLVLIRTEFQGERSAALTTNMRSQVTDGLSWLFRQPLLRFMAVITGGVNLAFAGANIIIIVLLQREMQASSSTIGLVFGLAATGGILGAVGGAWFQKRTTFGRAIMAVMWLEAILWTLLAAAPNIASVAVIGFLFFVSAPTYDIVQFSYRLALIPDDLQGRVNSVYRLIGMGGVPVGQAAAGVLVQWLGPRATILVLGAFLAMLAAAATLSGEVRRAPPVAQARARLVS